MMAPRAKHGRRRSAVELFRHQLPRPRLPNDNTVIRRTPPLSCSHVIFTAALPAATARSFPNPTLVQPMKKLLRLTFAAGLLALAVPFALTPATAAEKKDAAEKPAPVGSIRPTGKDLKPAELAALAKISFADALKAALKAAPGVVVKAELEVEDGNLQFAFEIIGADKKTTEVEIDAGNGKVLDIDKDDAGDKEDNEAKEKKKD
jgi:hypothetical protein